MEENTAARIVELLENIDKHLREESVHYVGLISEMQEVKDKLDDIAYKINDRLNEELDKLGYKLVDKLDEIKSALES